MNEWTPIIVMLLATLGVVAIVRRLIRLEDKIDMLTGIVVAESSIAEPDTSDIPEVDEEWFKKAHLRRPPK